jgi:hypothetical protein
VRKVFVALSALFTVALAITGTALKEPIFLWVAFATGAALTSFVAIERRRTARIKAQVDVVQHMLGLEPPRPRYNPKYVPAKATIAIISAEVTFFAGFTALVANKYVELGAAALVYCVVALVVGIRWANK